MEELDKILGDIRRLKVEIYRNKANNFLIGDHGSLIKGSGYEIKEITQWEPGDDFETIDWPLTLATWPDKVYKVNRIEEKEAPMVLIVDTSPSMLVRFSSEESKFPLMLKLIGSLGFAGLHVHDPVAIISFGSVADFFLRPKHSEGQILYAVQMLYDGAQEFYKNLERNKPWSKKGTNMNDALTVALTRVRRQSTVVLISDFVDVVSGQITLDMNVVKGLAARHCQNFISIFLEDEDEFNWQSGVGILVVKDIETGKLKEIKASRSGQIRQEWQSRRGELIKSLQKIGVSSLILSRLDYEQRLTDFIASR